MILCRSCPTQPLIFPPLEYVESLEAHPGGDILHGHRHSLLCALLAASGESGT